MSHYRYNFSVAVLQFTNKDLPITYQDTFWEVQDMVDGSQRKTGLWAGFQAAGGHDDGISLGICSQVNL